MSKYKKKGPTGFAVGMEMLAQIQRDAEAAKSRLASKDGIENKAKYAEFAFRPVAYCYEVLKVKVLSPAQELILNSLHAEPFATLVPSGNNQGKDYISACAANYWMDTFWPGVVITSGPNFEHVKQVLWGEIRIQRRRAGLDMTGMFPENPEWRLAEDHYATTLNVDKVESYRGRHWPRQLFLLDEATSFSAAIISTLFTMFNPDRGHSLLMIYNPTDITSPCYQEEQRAIRTDGTKRYNIIRLSAVDHPNIIAELKGEPKPIPDAVSLAQFRRWLDTTDEIGVAEYDPDKDILWPPKEYATAKNPVRCYRHEHAPDFQSRALGIWPSESNAVWHKTALDKALSDFPETMLQCERCGKAEYMNAKWAMCCHTRMVRVPFKPNFPLNEVPCIGCDTATGCGGDWYAAMLRWGDFALLHESSNTMDAVEIAGKLRIMTAFAVEVYNKVQPSGKKPIEFCHIPINIDDDGTGRAVCAILWRERYFCRPISGASSAGGPGSTAMATDNTYPNIRSQIWFEAARRAKQGALLLGGLPKIVRDRIRQQATGVRWKLNARGQHEVERKEITKERIGRSPDDVDGCQLSFFVPAVFASARIIRNATVKVLTNEQRHDEARERLGSSSVRLYDRMKGESSALRRNLFGRGRG